jgi:putative ABC transport system permease protein
VRPFLGRALSRGDDSAGSEQVLILKHGFWQRRYGGALDVIGRRVTLGRSTVHDRGGDAS